MSNTQDEFSYFSLGSGLPLDGAEVVITDAAFEFDTSYNADAVVCKMVYSFLNGEGEPQTQLYSVGKNWEPVDQGTAVAHTSGKRVSINKMSNYGSFVDGFLNCEGKREAMEVARARGLEPDRAALWIGMKFQMKMVSRPNPMEGAKKPTIDALVPAKFLGVDDAAGTSGTSATKTTGAAGSGSGTGSGAKATASNAGIDPDLLAQLNQLAQDASDFDTFMEQAMEMEGVAGNKAAEKAVMSSKAGSVWKVNNP